jgi:diguanylate cyclase (GGDEF)-like protein
MKYGFLKSVGFKLMMLLITIILTLVVASLLFNKQIDVLKRQIDSIYFGNFMPVLKLNNVANSYKDLIICINNPKLRCDFKKHKRVIKKNWQYYFKSYKTDKERAVINAINTDMQSSFEGKNPAKFNIMIQKINFLIEYETDEAYKQRKEFLNSYDSMKDYLLYNVIAIVLLALAVVIYIIYSVIKKDNQLTILNQKYKMEAITDSMTKLYNRNYFDTIFDNLPKISTANNWHSAFIMFDIDYFKQYNDTYGHDKGDETLKAVATTLKTYFNKEYEYVFRLGGEEFGVILFDIDKEILIECLKDINRNVRNLQIEHSGSQVEEVVTISIGAYLYKPNSDISTNRMYKLADENLYKAKQNGRNQYVI